MPLIFTRGNIFDSEADVLVNPVNTVGVQGAGLAKQFATRRPHQLEVYTRLCRKGELQPQHPYLVAADMTLLFPTKRHWKDPSDFNDVFMGLVNFAAKADSLNLSWAFPPLGCGLGGLNWKDVKTCMEEVLGPLESTIYIYQPK